MIYIYIVGYGNPTRNKLSIHHTQPEILRETNVGKVKTAIAGSVSNNRVVGFQSGELVRWTSDQSEMNLDQSGSTIYLNEAFFIDSIPARSIPEAILDSKYPAILSEMSPGSHAPIEVLFNVAEDAEPGDYDIHTTLTYGKEDNIKQDNDRVRIHVNTPREQLEPWVTRVAIISVGIALLSLVYDVGLVQHAVSWLSSTFLETLFMKQTSYP